MDTGGNVEPLVVAVEQDGSISYRSVLVVRSGSGIADLAGMNGKSLAWADPNSTSGYLIPRSELEKAGIDTEPGKYFSRTGFGGGHEQAVVAVPQKQYDGAATWASGVGDVSEGYTRGNLHEVVGKGVLKMGDLRILWTSSPILNGPLTARKDTPEGSSAATSPPSTWRCRRRIRTSTPRSGASVARGIGRPSTRTSRRSSTCGARKPPTAASAGGVRCRPRTLRRHCERSSDVAVQEAVRPKAACQILAAPGLPRQSRLATTRA